VFRAATAYVILFAAVGAYSPFLQQYYQSLGLPLPAIGLLAAFTSAVVVGAAPIWGAIHDHVPASRLLIPFAAMIATVGAVGLATAGATPLIVVAAGTWAVGMAGMGPMMDVRVLSMVGADRTRYGWIRACGSASFIVFAPIVGLLVDRGGMGALFWVMVPALALVGASAIALPPRHDSVRPSSLRKAPGTVLRHRPIALFLVGSLVAWTAISAQTSFFSIYLGSLGAPGSVVGWTWAIAATLEVPTMFLFPWLARRVGVERLIVIGAAITFLRQVANVVFTAPALLLACSLIQGAGYALILIGGVTFVSLQAPKGTAATAQGLLSGVTASLAAILGSGVGGQLAGLLTIRGLYFVSACLGALGVVTIAVAVLPVARERAMLAARAGAAAALPVPATAAPNAAPPAALPAAAPNAAPPAALPAAAPNAAPPAALPAAAPPAADALAEATDRGA
jgi:PPP family 3-phenylpropionic acid transporter